MHGSADACGAIVENILLPQLRAMPAFAVSNARNDSSMCVVVAMRHPGLLATSAHALLKPSSKIDSRPITKFFFFDFCQFLKNPVFGMPRTALYQ